MNLLFIHPRRGLYRVTECQQCKHIFECDNCDAQLVTYRESRYGLEMVCHQCQSHYKYPLECPNCKATEIISKVGGIDDLAEELNKKYAIHAKRLDTLDVFDQIQKEVTTMRKTPQFYLTTRVFDPAIPYSLFDEIIFIQAQNLLASPDYLVTEETMKQLAELLQAIPDGTQIFFDTKNPSSPLFQELLKLHTQHTDSQNIAQWFTSFLDQEKKNREMFGFPPYRNIVLITATDRNKEKAFGIAESGYLELKKHLTSDGISFTPPYPARFLKRKNLFSYHFLVKYPRKFEQFEHMRQEISDLADRFRLQVRLNPKHLF